MNNNNKNTNIYHGIYKSNEGLPKIKVRYISSFKNIYYILHFQWNMFTRNKLG